MLLIDAQAVSLRFDGEIVGGILRFFYMEGQESEVTFRPISGEPQARPIQHDYGSCRVLLKTDHSDPGQNALRQNLVDRELKEMQIDYANGTVQRFSAFCQNAPVSGQKQNQESVAGSQIVIRLNGHPY